MAATNGTTTALRRLSGDEAVRSATEEFPVFPLSAKAGHPATASTCCRSNTRPDHELPLDRFAPTRARRRLRHWGPRCPCADGGFLGASATSRPRGAARRLLCDCSKNPALRARRHRPMGRNSDGQASLKLRDDGCYHESRCEGGTISSPINCRHTVVVQEEFDGASLDGVSL